MNRNTRIKLLFVIGHLKQGGAERFTYEVVKAIDRNRFDVAVLTSRGAASGFYYNKIRQLGIPIHRKLPLLLGRLQRHARPLFLRTRPLLEMLHRWFGHLTLGHLLDQYDVINAVQIENYYLLQPLLESNDRVVVYLMSHRFQYRFDQYADCYPDRSYRFSLFDASLRDEYANSPCRNAEEIAFPLVLDMSERADLSEYARLEPPYRIGVFIRLAADRPMSGIFQAFAKLRQSVPAELWVYGRGNPARFERELDVLGIRNDVLFRGHTFSIEQTLREDGLSLVWMTSFGPLIAYASIEVASHGFPILFWNQHGHMPPDQIRAKTEGNIQGYFDPTELALATSERLQRPDDLRKQGRDLRSYVIRNHDISSFIAPLEHELERIATSNRQALTDRTHRTKDSKR